MPRVRLLHLSDLHLAGHPRSKFVRRIPMKGYDLTVLRRVAAFAFRHKDVLDGIVISGDLAQSGLSRDLRLAADFVHLPPSHSPLEWLVDNGPAPRWPTLQASATPIALVPGNHDRFRGPWLAGPGSEGFDEFFERDWEAGIGGVQKFVFPDEEHPYLTVLCADFSLAHTKDATVLTGHWGQGKVYSADDNPRLQALVAETKEVQEKTRSAVIWMVHFAPEFEQVEELPNLPENLWLIDAGDLLQEADDLGIHHILCGHTHVLAPEYRSRSRPPVRVYCVGSSAILSASTEPSMRELEFTVEGPRIVRARYKDWAWDRVGETFRHVSA